MAEVQQTVQQTNDAIQQHPVDQEIISLATYLGKRGKLVDIHKLTIAVRLGKLYAEVSPYERLVSKHWGLGALYGGQRFDWKTEAVETPELLALVERLGELPEGTHRPMPPFPTLDTTGSQHADGYKRFMEGLHGE